MNFWAIIKMIAGIISNLPFDGKVTEEQVQQVVQKEFESNPQVQAAVEGQGLTQEDIREILVHVAAIVMIIVRSRSNVSL